MGSLWAVGHPLLFCSNRFDVNIPFVASTLQWLYGNRRLCQLLLPCAARKIELRIRLKAISLLCFCKLVDTQAPKSYQMKSTEDEYMSAVQFFGQFSTRLAVVSFDLRWNSDVHEGSKCFNEVSAVAPFSTLQFWHRSNTQSRKCQKCCFLPPEY